MGSLTQNVRYAFRMLAKNPGFTAAAVACLALGIGATTAIFSVVYAVLLRPLPYSQPARLVRIFTEFPTFPNGGLRHFWVSEPEFLDLRRDITSFDMIEAWANNGVNLAGAAEPVRATASYVSGGMLPMLGVAPILGRSISPEDDRPGIPETAVLSYALWQRAYGGDPGAVGRDIRLNGNPCRVIGVMPPGFAFPPGELDAPELWVPIQIDPAKPGGRGGHYLNLLGRLRGVISFPQAQGEMDRYVKHVGETVARSQHPFDPAFHPVVLAGFQDEVVRTVRRAMLVLLGAVVFVLLIACVNVANLLLARSEARRKEIAVRAAIGAGLGRLLQQFVVEGVLLSLAGAAFGMLLAFGGLRLLVATNAGSIPRAARDRDRLAGAALHPGGLGGHRHGVRPRAGAAREAFHPARHAQGRGGPDHGSHRRQSISRRAGDRRTGAGADPADRLRPDGQGVLETAGSECRLQSRPRAHHAALPAHHRVPRRSGIRRLLPIAPRPPQCAARSGLRFAAPADSRRAAPSMPMTR